MENVYNVFASTMSMTNKISTSEPKSNILLCFFGSQQRALFAQLSGGEDEFNSREAQLLVSILSVLSRQLQPPSQQVSTLISFT